MDGYQHALHWMRVEIPAYLDKLGSAAKFIERYNRDCASFMWYQFAVEAAIQRWPSHAKELSKLRKNIRTDSLNDWYLSVDQKTADELHKIMDETLS